MCMSKKTFWCLFPSTTARHSLKPVPHRGLSLRPIGYVAGFSMRYAPAIPNSVPVVGFVPLEVQAGLAPSLVHCVTGVAASTIPKSGFRTEVAIGAGTTAYLQAQLRGTVVGCSKVWAHLHQAAA
jgi:hypothetical protein